jgi:hypothetical protein
LFDQLYIVGSVPGHYSTQLTRSSAVVTHSDHIYSVIRYGFFSDGSVSFTHRHDQPQTEGSAEVTTHIVFFKIFRLQIKV